MATFKRTSIRRKRKISSLKLVIAEIKKKFKISTDALDVIEKSFSGVPMELMRRILLNNRANTKSKNSRKAYPVELKRFAMTLQFYSTKAYEYVRKSFNLALPATSTIRAWLSKIDCSPGFTKPALDSLAMRATQYREKTGQELLCCLLLDEMSLKTEIVCEKQSGYLWGYVDVGANTEPSNDQELANHAFVFMIVGVNDCFKIPIGYFLIKSLCGEERANLVLEALKQIENFDLRVLAVTCDGPHVHFKMMKELGCGIENVHNLNPYFYNSNRKVHVLFDICHMLKLVRNNWASAKVFIDGDGNTIKWDYIEALHQIQEDEGIYFANKLRQKHIKWKKFIMKVIIKMFL